MGKTINKRRKPIINNKPKVAFVRFSIDGAVPVLIFAINPNAQKTMKNIITNAITIIQLPPFP